MLPASIARALAIPAAAATGTIRDVEHVVIFMQENRAFDHYFGALRGVRGFGDRQTATLPGGDPVWRQPNGDGDPLLPFRLNTRLTSGQFAKDLDHGWNGTHAAWNGGRWDQWVAAKSWWTMGYYTREDLPFHYALADAFTICDAYFCSVQGPTNPNRLYLWSGMVDPAGSGGGPVIGNDEPGFSWTTYPERLQAAGISWRVYQNPGSDAFTGNYDDNALAWFNQYRTAPADSPLHVNGMSKWTLHDLADDVMKGTLPQVSWVVAPAAFSEHPQGPPMFGAWYTSQLLDALTANPEVWSNTVLLIMYDENDGYFDHVVAPTAPASAAQGASTIDTAGEFFAGDGQPFGLGPRVPLLAISPWSRGGYVCSQVFDHTSVIRFLEQRFGVVEPNISAWRRSVCGDLTSCFDFANPDVSLPVLPDTRSALGNAAAVRQLADPAVPLRQRMPRPEPGSRPARALPYAVSIDGRPIGGGAFRVEWINRGSAGASFHLYDLTGTDAPRLYTVGAGDRLSADCVPASAGGRYDFRVLGPNGLARRFSGVLGNALQPVTTLTEQPRLGKVMVELRNDGTEPVVVVVEDIAYGGGRKRRRLQPGQYARQYWSVAFNAYWYDLQISVVGDAQFSQRFSGHVETGATSSSDPAA